MFTPSYFDTATNYEIKIPAQIEKNMPEVKDVIINYFDSKGEYVFGVTQIKSFSFEPRGEQVIINGVKGWYEPYLGKEPTGARLKWIQSGTYLELDTINLSKDSLLRIAKSMKIIK